MLQIVLTDEQAKVVASALKPVQVRDTKDHILGWINPIWTEADVAKAKQILASDQPWFTTEQVLEKLRLGEDMTRYTVIWSNEALDQLAQIWLDAPDGSAVNAAANSIDRELTRDPQNKGAALSEGLRVLEFPPLHILFPSPNRIAWFTSFSFGSPVPRNRRRTATVK